MATDGDCAGWRSGWACSRQHRLGDGDDLCLAGVAMTFVAGHQRAGETRQRHVPLAKGFCREDNGLDEYTGRSCVLDKARAFEQYVGSGRPLRSRDGTKPRDKWIASAGDRVH
jgi:hypothetical protein